jgi:endonuclease-3
VGEVATPSTASAARSRKRAPNGSVDEGPAHDRLLAIHDRLLGYYGQPPPRTLQDPLSELIQTVLSQNTADVNSDRAYASLMQRFGGDWDALRAAPVGEIADAIRIGGLAEIKSVRIKSILDRIVETVGELDLSFLREGPLDEGRAFLRSLGGVGPKTAACVLLFSCGKPALPVDTHVHRVSQRLGLVPQKATAEQAHALLEAMVPEHLVYSFHMLVIGHGRQICKAQRPRCFECPVEDVCPYPSKGASVGSRDSTKLPSSKALGRVAHAGPLPPDPVAPTSTPRSPLATA